MLFVDYNMVPIWKRPKSVFAQVNLLQKGQGLAEGTVLLRQLNQRNTFFFNNALPPWSLPSAVFILFIKSQFHGTENK